MSVIQSQSKTSMLLLKRRKLFNWDMWEPVIKLLVVVLGFAVIAVALERGILRVIWP